MKDSGVGGFGSDYPGGFSWPPRSYTCSFCKREFRSAQALGGHMNVHRRDRARLRQSPPWDGHSLILNPNPNPNPNSTFLSSSSPSTRIPPFTYTFPSLLSPSLTRFSSSSLACPSEVKIPCMARSQLDPLSPRDGDLTKKKTMKLLYGVGELEGFTQEDERKILKKTGIVRLDLEIGLRRDLKEDLDLELRLGYS
ncbi:hypothetical protein HHK36_026869 [Tetracentron sinense]|uniref:C2H2-type domain-containing protein n=1 Tax=Tetracentron sinense TaxID=13715 RepID=A0A835D2J0_TETSI|nr:hypothetical protein HHK36_026869 [Tetracentron sinense]